MTTHRCQDSLIGSKSALYIIINPFFIQGRSSWWNPVQQTKPDYDEEDVEEDEEERNEPDEPEPEVGPPLLTPLAEDESMSTTSVKWDRFNPYI